MQIGRFVEMGVVVMMQLRGCFIRVCRYCQSERLIGSKLKKVLSELEHKSFQVGCVDNNALRYMISTALHTKLIYVVLQYSTAVERFGVQWKRCHYMY